MTKRLSRTAAMLILLSSTASMATIHNVSIPGFSFSPASLSITQGDTVTWTNNHSLPHTATSDALLWDTGTLTTGQSASIVFDSAGVFPYHCAFHPSMLGTLTVNALVYDTLIEINDFYFNPIVIQIAPGQTIRWINMGGVDHTTTADGGLWDSGILANGQFFDFTFSAEGVYDYHCDLHPMMMGTVVVGTPDSVVLDIRISGFDFVPPAETVMLGDYIRWINFDDMPHTSTSDSGQWNSGNLDPGDFYILRMTTPGVFPYHCDYHPSMTDTIFVLDTVVVDTIVEIIDFAFNPQVLLIAPGKLVRWINNGGLHHTTTADSGQWDSGMLMPGQYFDYLFTSEGVYDYHCTPHPFMTGTVVVGRPDSVALDIKIVDFAFVPADTTVSLGSYVRWLNTGELVHTATADSGQWDSGNLNPGDFYIRRMEEVGDFPYHCTPHPAMTAILHVEDTTGFLPGDANGDGNVLGSDVTYLVRYFKGLGPAPNPILAGDTNGDCNVLGSDVTYLVRYFKGLGPAPHSGSCL